jgi:hypothetical protein
MHGLSTHEVTTLAFESNRPARRESGNTPASPTAPWRPQGAYGEPISQLTTDDRALNATQLHWLNEHMFSLRSRRRASRFAGRG